MNHWDSSLKKKLLVLNLCHFVKGFGLESARMGHKSITKACTKSSMLRLNRLNMFKCSVCSDAERCGHLSQESMCFFRNGRCQRLRRLRLTRKDRDVEQHHGSHAAGDETFARQRNQRLLEEVEEVAVAMFVTVCSEYAEYIRKPSTNHHYHNIHIPYIWYVVSVSVVNFW